MKRNGKKIVTKWDAHFKKCKIENHKSVANVCACDENDTKCDENETKCYEMGRKL